MTVSSHGGSASIAEPDYWWYQARTQLLETVMREHLPASARVLDVGSADGPSVEWLRRHEGLHVPLDIDPRGLASGSVCASALELPFADATFDVVGAFDVLEHCEPESQALAELSRVLTPGGCLLLSVPAYDWAWSDFDEANGHHRRYTRERAVDAVHGAGLEVVRATYAFSSVFPFFAAERLARRASRALRRGSRTQASDVVELPQLPGWTSRMLLRLSQVDRSVLHGRDLAFGSSVLVVARKAVAVSIAPGGDSARAEASV